MAKLTPSMAATQNTMTWVRRLSCEVSFQTSILFAKKLGTVRIAALVTDAATQLVSFIPSTVEVKTDAHRTAGSGPGRPGRRRSRRSGVAELLAPFGRPGVREHRRGGEGHGDRIVLELSARTPSQAAGDDRACRCAGRKTEPMRHTIPRAMTTHGNARRTTIRPMGRAAAAVALQRPRTAGTGCGDDGGERACRRPTTQHRATTGGRGRRGRRRPTRRTHRWSRAGRPRASGRGPIDSGRPARRHVHVVSRTAGGSSKSFRTGTGTPSSGTRDRPPRPGRSRRRREGAARHRGVDPAGERLYASYTGPPTARANGRVRALRAAGWLVRSAGLRRRAAARRPAVLEPQRRSRGVRSRRHAVPGSGRRRFRRRSGRPRPRIRRRCWARCCALIPLGAGDTRRTIRSSVRTPLTHATRSGRPAFAIRGGSVSTRTPGTCGSATSARARSRRSTGSGGGRWRRSRGEPRLGPLRGRPGVRRRRPGTGRGERRPVRHAGLHLRPRRRLLGHRRRRGPRRALARPRRLLPVRRLLQPGDQSGRHCGGRNGRPGRADRGPRRRGRLRPGHHGPGVRHQPGRRGVPSSSPG